MSPDITQLYAKAVAYKAAIDRLRPLPEGVAKGLADYFRIELTYSSNAIEGNTLTLTETKVLLEDGLTVGGKPIRDYYEASGHAKAYDYMLAAATAEPFVLSEVFIKELHRLFYSLVDDAQAGRYRTERVFITGTTYLPPSPAEVPGAMADFVDRMNGLRGSVHPIEWAAMAHKGLVDIHPFVDGNGRTARLLMNVILTHPGYGLAVIPAVLRQEYIETLRTAQREQAQDAEPFLRLIAGCVTETQRDYCRMLGIPLKDVWPKA